MANGIDDKDKLNEDAIGSTSFGGANRTGGSYFYPNGRLGQFLAKFFATKAQPYVADQTKDGPTPQAALAGDALHNPDVVKTDGMPVGSLDRKALVLPELERTRKRRYQQFEQMDEYPEIGAPFDIYADDSTQKSLRGDRWNIRSDSQLVIDEVARCFDTINLDRYYWEIVRNTVKYGDHFIETIIDVNAPKKGIQRIKALNPNFILRVENEYGYLTDFLQEIPEENDWSAYGSAAEGMQGRKFIELDRNQIVHFRLRTSDPSYYPYGKSIAALAIRIFRSLKLMEDAMLIYRLARAPERRIFYIDVANMPSTKAEVFIEKVKEKFKKERYYNQNDGSINSRYNPLSADEDFFVPTRGGNGTKIETLPGAQNLGDVDDVRYFRDKLLASLKVPKDYIVEKDKSPERKANLSQLDAKFARVILRVQQQVEVGLEQIAKRHLALVGFPANLVKDVKVQLPDPSDVFTKRKMEIDEQKARVVAAVVGTGLFPKSTIYKEYYDMNEQEIEHTLEQVRKEQEEDAQIVQDQETAGAQAEADIEQDGLSQEADRNEVAAQADHEREQEIMAAQPKSQATSKKESVERKLQSVLSKAKKKIIEESSNPSTKLLVLDRVINRKKTKL